MLKVKRSKGPSWMRLVTMPRPALPITVYGEDFSVLIRAPRRLRIARGRIVVLS